MTCRIAAGDHCLFHAQAGVAEAAPTLEQQEGLLDELLDIVEDIDHARLVYALRCPFFD